MSHSCLVESSFGILDLAIFFCHFSVVIILMNISGIKICTYLSLYAINPKKTDSNAIQGHQSNPAQFSRSGNRIVFKNRSCCVQLLGKKVAMMPFCSVLHCVGIEPTLSPWIALFTFQHSDRYCLTVPPLDLQCLIFPNLGSEFEFCSECLIGKTVLQIPQNWIDFYLPCSVQSRAIRGVAGTEGFEPPRICLTSNRSTRLNYVPKKTAFSGRRNT